MKKCPRCNADVPAAEDLFCRSCGSDLTTDFDDSPEDSAEQTDPDFTVIEASCGSPQLLGSEPEKDSPGETGTAVDAPGYDNHTIIPDSDDQPIGSSAPPPPPAVDAYEPYEPSVGDPALLPGSADSRRPFPDSDASIEGRSGFMTASEREELMRKLSRSQQEEAPSPDGGSDIPAVSEEPTAATAAPPSEPESEDSLPRPQMASRGKGVAFYFRNLVQLAGHPPLASDDVLILNDREYELRPKQIDSRILIGSAAAVAAVFLIFIASLFVGDGATGQGQIIGVVLDDLNQPFLGRSMVTLPDIGKSFAPNAQGIFRCAGIPTGAHEVQYFVGRELVGTEYATVVDAEVTTLLLRPAQMAEAYSVPEDPRPDQETPATADASLPNQSARSTSTSTTESKEAKSRWAKLALAANVEGARLTVDGEVLGAGNLTYAKLLPGDHRYVVSKEGYEDAKGTVTLKGNKTATLDITLQPSAPAETTYGADDFYYSGLTLAEAGDFGGAIGEYTQSVKLDPSHAEAYLARAAAHAKLKSLKAAYDDYRQAAVAYRARGDYNRAITAYNKAIDLNGEGLEAYLGRAGIYLAKKQSIAALADFEAARDIDGSDSRTHFGLGEARFQQGNYKRAIEHFKDARSADDTNPLVHQYLTLSYLALDNEKEVRKSFEKFSQFASPDEMKNFRANEQYAAVQRIMESN